MKIDDEGFLCYFKETIALLALYGKNGRRYEDAGIISIINDNRAAPSSSTVNLKMFSEALREVDAKWLAAHSNDQEQSQRAESPRDEARSTKALFI